MKSIEITANSYAEALKEALEQLGLSENEVDAEKIKETGLIRKKSHRKSHTKSYGSRSRKRFSQWYHPKNEYRLQS